MSSAPSRGFLQTDGEIKIARAFYTQFQLVTNGSFNNVASKQESALFLPLHSNQESASFVSWMVFKNRPYFWKLIPPHKRDRNQTN